LVKLASKDARSFGTDPMMAVAWSKKASVRIGAEHYFDLTARWNASDNFSFTFTIQNLLNNKPKVVGNTIGSTSFNNGNVFPSTYDALGRRFGVAAKLTF
jgi:iron complex outermembrane receptor protein